MRIFIRSVGVRQQAVRLAHKAIDSSRSQRRRRGRNRASIAKTVSFDDQSVNMYAGVRVSWRLVQLGAQTNH